MAGVLAIAAIIGVVLSSGGGGKPQPAEEAPALTTATLFKDDFSDPAKTLFARTLGPGTNPQGLAFDRRLENGEFVVQLSKGGNSSYISDGFVPVYDQAFVLEVDARAEGKIDSIGYGFVMNYVTDGPRLQVLPATGEYVVPQFSAGQSVTLARRLSALLLKGPATNHIRVEVSGTEMKLFLNGQHTETLAGAVPERRPINVYLSAWALSPRDIQSGEDVRVIFDNFQASTLLSGASAPATKIVAGDDFGDASKTLFPKTGSLIPTGFSFDRGPVNNEYRVKIVRGGNESAIYSAGPTWLDAGGFALEVEGRAQGKTESLAYGFALNPDTPGGLRIRVQPGQGSYRTTYSISGRSTLVSEKTVPVIEKAAGLNRLRIEVRGTEAKVFVNGALVDTVSHDSLIQRPVVLYLAAWSVGTGVTDGDDATVVFDNFKVFSLPAASK